MIITNTTTKDIPEIFRLYKLASEYQKVIFPENIWPEFSKELIETEISEKRQFKLLIDNQMACIWSITYNDVDIWEEMENNCSIYIHRITTNPNFKGNNYVRKIVEWSKQFAKNQDKQFVRLDTCGRNDRLINHYINCGFNFLGMKKLQNTSELPSHYCQAEVCFFEIKLNETT